MVWYETIHKGMAVDRLPFHRSGHSRGGGVRRGDGRGALRGDDENGVAGALGGVQLASLDRTQAVCLNRLPTGKSS